MRVETLNAYLGAKRHIDKIPFLVFVGDESLKMIRAKDYKAVMKACTGKYNGIGVVVVHVMKSKECMDLTIEFPNAGIDVCSVRVEMDPDVVTREQACGHLGYVILNLVASRMAKEEYMRSRQFQEMVEIIEGALDAGRAGMVH